MGVISPESLAEATPYLIIAVVIYIVSKIVKKIRGERDTGKHLKNNH